MANHHNRTKFEEKIKDEVEALNKAWEGNDAAQKRNAIIGLYKMLVGEGEEPQYTKLSSRIIIFDCLHALENAVRQDIFSKGEQWTDDLKKLTSELTTRFREVL